MSSGGSDPQARAIQRFRDARAAWGRALQSHKMAPPDAGFASRLRALANAAELEREACEQGAQAGLQWRPIPGAQGAKPPPELRPDSGRRGPADLWQRFDEAVEAQNHAITGTSNTVVARAFGELASATAALADAVEAEDRETSETPLRRQAV